jgi:hypothetical protein
MSITPIPPQALLASPLLNNTRSFYQVLKLPAPLAGMEYPKGTPWVDLRAAGFASVVCLTDSIPSYDPAPLRVLFSAAFRDLAGGCQPLNPEREADMLLQVVDKVCSELMASRGVVVHCQGGTGRTGTVIACTLRAMGVPKDTLLRYMDSINQSRNKYHGWRGWPESTWQRQQVDRFHQREDLDGICTSSTGHTVAGVRTIDEA